jgi:murein L,D-transpeptidase YafK
MPRSPVFSLTFLLLILFPALSGQAGQSVPVEVRADRIVVAKAAREMVLLANGQVLKTYQVALGRNPVGPKEMEGDRKTPEGTYVIDFRNPKSAYHRALHISYPSPDDLRRASENGVSPGGDIMIHGLRKGAEWAGADHRYFDWTKGCIAVTNEEIEEIWRVVLDGTPIEIRP